MKQKLLTLFVLLVSAMTAFADDATGSGVATKDHNGAALAENQYVSYSYKFTEDNGNVTMTVTSKNPAAIQDWSSGGLNGETYDGKRTWTGVTTIEDGITIKPLRKNAIIVATGSVADDVYSADSKYDAIKDMANLVVLVNGYYHPIKQLEFVDIPGEPLWMGGLRDLNDFISTGNTGWKVTRKIPAHTHATVCVTNAIVNIPANLRAWEAVDYDETTGIKFNKASVIGANYPYVVRNATDEDTDLSFTGTNDLNFKTIMDTEANKHKVGSTNIYFRGNWKEALVTNGTQWIIKNEGIHASIVKADGVKISPFRAYFTGIPEGASAKLNFDDEETTGITNVNAAESNDDTLYNLAGQKVNAAYKGIVIKNGKKYLVK